MSLLLYGKKTPSEWQKKELASAVNNATFIVDKSAISSGLLKKNRDEKLNPTIYQLDQDIHQIRPFLFTKGSIKERPQRELISNSLEKLTATFEPKKMSVICLVNDTSTESTGKDKFKNRFHHDESWSEEKIGKRLKTAKGSTVAMVGHVEDGKFVQKNENDEVVFSASPDRLNQLAKLGGCNLVLLGCNVASIKADAAVKVVGKYNTVVGIEKIGEASQNSETWMEFLEQLAGQELRIVVDVKEISVDAKTRTLVLRLENMIDGKVIGILLLTTLISEEEEDENLDIPFPPEDNLEQIKDYASWAPRVFKEAIKQGANISAGELNSLAWSCCIAGKGSDSLFAAERAVELKPNEIAYLDTRAVAYAQSGKFDQAVADLKKIVSEGDFGASSMAKRRQWLIELTAGSNPFDTEKKCNELLGA